MKAAQGVRLLLVDDEPHILQFLELGLINEGFEVQTAQDGLSAIAMSADFKPHVVILDVMMPGMDGPTTLGHLRRQATLATVPVAFMTAKVQPQEVAHYLSLGACEVIPKPFNPMTLAQQVRDAWQKAASA